LTYFCDLDTHLKKIFKRQDLGDYHRYSDTCHRHTRPISKHVSFVDSTQTSAVTVTKFRNFDVKKTFNSTFFTSEFRTFVISFNFLSATRPVVLCRQCPLNSATNAPLGSPVTVGGAVCVRGLGTNCATLWGHTCI